MNILLDFHICHLLTTNASSCFSSPNFLFFLAEEYFAPPASIQTTRITRITTKMHLVVAFQFTPCKTHDLEIFLFFFLTEQWKSHALLMIDKGCKHYVHWRINSYLQNLWGQARHIYQKSPLGLKFCKSP